jgi:hypothetical protein
MHVAHEYIIAKHQRPLTQEESTTLQQRLYSIEAAGSDQLIIAAATVLADAVAAFRGSADSQTDIAALESEVRANLERSLSPGTSILQTTAAEIIHVIQALLVFGRCEGFEGMPAPYAAKTVTPKWATALLVRSFSPNALHGMVGEVAHDLCRICAVAEAAYGDILESLFSQP